jgi:hypothetical protein
MGVQPCLERIPRCLSDGTNLLHWTTSVKNRHVFDCGHGASSVLLSRIFFFRVKSSKRVILCVFFSPILCSAILLNAIHIGDCYRDFPLLPVCCRYPLVSRSRQVMSFLFWGGSMGFRHFFRLGDGNIFVFTFFFVFFSADLEKNHVYSLECFVDLWFFSLLWFGTSLMYNFCRRLISLHNYFHAWCLRNWCLWQQLRRVMSFRHYCKESTE